MAYRFIFGPVLSGRIGLSLGLDLLGSPVCSMDCVYCEVGATEELTLERKAYVPAKEILAELEDWAANGGHAEIVTLGGAGEPTLNTDLGEIIDGVRRILPGMPVAVLTNSTLMPDPEVRAQLARADVVLPSLDSLVEAEFRKINRTAKGLTAADIAKGLVAFRAEFTGRMHLEILLCKGLNDSEENLERLAAFVPLLAPDRVDVTTLSRPGTLETARAVDGETLARWREKLGGLVGNTAEESAKTAQEADRASERAREIDDDEARELVEASLARRPQTVLQLSRALNATPASIERALKALEQAGRLATRAEGQEAFHSLRRT